MSLNLYLSYDDAVIQWIMTCDKNRMATRVTTLWPQYVTSLTTSVSTMRLLIEIMLNLGAIKSNFKGSKIKGLKINRILHEWSFHMKFMKLAEGSFHKFHMK